MSGPGDLLTLYSRWKIGALALAVILATPHDHARAADWPQWRGPGRDAVSKEGGLLESWPDGGPPLAWQASGVGTGYSSVVVSQGRVFTIGRQNEDVVVTALESATGKPAWARKIATTSRNPCSTPTADGDRLYALGPDGHLTCLKFATGGIVWQKHFVEDFGGRMMSGRGFGESPLVDGDRLICTPGGSDAVLVALDKRTGDVVWRSKVPDIGPGGREGAGFSSIVVAEAAGMRQYVQLTGRGLVGVAATDGRFLWGYNAIANDTANIPTPVVQGDLVFAANGYNAGSVLLRLVPDRQPGAATPGVKAEPVNALNGSQFQNHHGGIVRVGDHLYGGHGSNNGLPTCVELQTGRVLWKRRGPGVGAAAVVFSDGRFYFSYQNGLVALIEASPAGFALHGTLQIPGAGGDSWAHPVVANGRLYLREQDTLRVHDIRRETAPATPTDPAAPLADKDPAMGKLRKLGVAVEPIAFLPPKDAASPAPDSRRAVESRRLYSYAARAEGKAEADVPVLVILADKHLTLRGEIATELAGLLKSLRTPFILSLAGTRVRDAGLTALADFNGLVGLNLEFCAEITDTGLESVLKARELRVLVLAGTAVTDAGIRVLAAHKNLSALDLEVCDGVADAACEALGTMRQLQAVVVKKTGFERKRVSDAGLQHLRNLTDLEVLNLYGNKVTDAGLSHLEELKMLRALDLSLLALTDRGLVHLQPLTELRQLELLYSEGFAGPILTDAGLEALEPLAKLTALNLTGARLTDAGLDRLRSLKKLTTLRLGRTSVTPDGIRRFKAVLPDCDVVSP